MREPKARVGTPSPASSRTVLRHLRAMKITRILPIRSDCPVGRRLSLVRWQSRQCFDSTVVPRVETDAGLAGHGEVCPLGPAYLPAYAGGVRAGLRELAPHLIGEDPRQLMRINRRMDAALKGHPYVKSGLDIACWDLLGQDAGLPVCELLGGRYAQDVPLYRPFPRNPRRPWPDASQAIAAKNTGVSNSKWEAIPMSTFSGSTPSPRACNPATGWLRMPTRVGVPHEAVRVARAVREVDVYIEQPCLYREECLAVRRQTGHPFILDETVDSLERLLQVRRTSPPTW